MVTILEIPYREASRTWISLGFYESLKQTARNIIARSCNTRKCHFVDYKQPRFATRFLEAITDPHFYQSFKRLNQLRDHWNFSNFGSVYIFSLCITLCFLSNNLIFSQTWSDPVIISKPASNSCSDFIIDKNKVMHCVWQIVLSATHKQIFYSKSANLGETWTDPVPITNNPDLRTDNPQIVADTSGNLYVCYEYDCILSMKICYVKLNYGDSIWSQPIEIGHGLSPRMAVDKNNRVYIFWSTGVEQYRYIEDGLLSEIFTMCSGPVTGCLLDDIAVDQQNTFHCIGTQFIENGGQGAWFTYDDNNWNPYVALSEKTFWESAISLNSIGEPSFVWRQSVSTDRTLTSTYFSECKNDTIQPAVLLGQKTTYPEIVLDYTDKPHVVECQQTDSNYQLVHRHRTSQGWLSQIVEENKIWYIQNNLISLDNSIFWVYNRADTIINPLTGTYYALVLFRKLELQPGLIENSMNEQLCVFPNPFSERLTIKFNKPGIDKCILSVLDLAGRTLFQRVIYTSKGENIISWKGTDNNGNRLDPGYYLIDLEVV